MRTQQSAKPTNHNKSTLFLKAFALVLLSAIAFPAGAISDCNEEKTLQGKADCIDGNLASSEKQYNSIFADESNNPILEPMKVLVGGLLSTVKQVHEKNKKSLELFNAMKEAGALIHSSLKTPPAICFNAESKRIATAMQKTTQKLQGLFSRASGFKDSVPEDISVIEKTTKELKQATNEFRTGVNELNNACKLTR